MLLNKGYYWTIHYVQKYNSLPDKFAKVAEQVIHII